MFIDRARISVKAGDGGYGMSSFRREKFVPKGGPSGGDGGRGGSIVFVGDQNLNTLLNFRYKRAFKGAAGANGQTCNMHGKTAETLYVRVPPGTVVKDEQTGEILADIVEAGQEAVIAKGGRGGRGNARFVNSVHRAPTFAELGEPGEERQLVLELKLIADVGLVGYPSVGKSSILARVSAAKPDVAAYHFTTLTPVLGVVDLGEERSFVLADIPGLIEGAHEGIGLGHDFLRHIERTKIIIHVLDIAGMDGREPLEDYHKINEELKLYNERLAARPQLVALNKMDLPSARDKYQEVFDYLTGEGREVFAISAATGEGLQELMNRAERLAAAYVEEPEENKSTKVYELKENEAEVTISRRDDGGFVVNSAALEKLVAMTNFNNDEALRRFQKIWRKLDIEEKLRQRGIEEGDSVSIGEMEFEFKK